MNEAMDMLSGILPLVLAGGVLYVAWQQWNTNRNRLKLELFDRRYEVFRAAVDIIDHVMREATIRDDEIAERFIRASRYSEFLFDDNVYNYLGELRDKLVRWRVLTRRLEAMPEGEERIEMVRKERELIEWLIEQIPVIRRKLKPFLKLQV